MKSHYELLGVAPDAPAEEIKRAFRREIAKYHPDKVQHLGQEFQDIASVRAAELTRAYKTLTDPGLRAEYDTTVPGAGAPTPPAAPEPVPAAAPAAAQPAQPAEPEPSRAAPQDSPSASQFERERAGARQFVSRAAMARFRAALDAECPGAQPYLVDGFEIGCLPKGAFFSFRLPPRLLARQTAAVTAEAVGQTASLLARVKKDGQRDLCVFLLGEELAPPSALAPAVAELRRRVTGAGGTLFIVPVSTQDWRAHMPADAPDLVRAILARLKP